MTGYESGLNLTPNLLLPQKHINSDWVPVWKNPANSNSEGKRKTVRDSGEFRVWVKFFQRERKCSSNIPSSSYRGSTVSIQVVSVLFLTVSCPINAILSSFDVLVSPLLRPSKTERKTRENSVVLRCPNKSFKNCPHSTPIVPSLRLSIDRRFPIEPWPQEDEKCNKKIWTRFFRQWLFSAQAAQAQLSIQTCVTCVRCNFWRLRDMGTNIRN